jgi:hypothetical protein
MKTYFKPGSWNCICDICGFQFKALELRQNWKGQMVCKSDFEFRNPQDFIQVPTDNPSTPWSRPEAVDTFVPTPTGVVIQEEGSYLPLLTELGVALLTEI